MNNRQEIIKEQRFKIFTGVLKLLLSSVSIYLLFQTILGNKHDVLSFYRSLFLLSYPIFFEITDSLLIAFEKNDKIITSKNHTILIMSWILCLICLLFAIITLFTTDDFPNFYEHIHKNYCWGFAVIFLVLFLVCFIIYSIRKVVKPLLFHKSALDYEER